MTKHQPYNVVAILKGSDPVLSREYLVIESHLDGAVGTRAVNGDDIYNAADDMHARYHGPADEARFLDPGKMQAIARTVLVMAWTLADSPERPRIDKRMPVIVPNYK